MQAPCRQCWAQADANLQVEDDSLEQVLAADATDDQGGLMSLVDSSLTQQLKPCEGMPP